MAAPVGCNASFGIACRPQLPEQSGPRSQHPPSPTNQQRASAAQSPACAHLTTGRDRPSAAAVAP
jgi:hypothetical protein